VHPDICSDTNLIATKEDLQDRKLYILTGLGQIKILNISNGSIVTDYSHDYLTTR
jgi:hypothetical protein